MPVAAADMSLIISTSTTVTRHAPATATAATTSPTASTTSAATILIISTWTTVTTSAAAATNSTAVTTATASVASAAETTCTAWVVTAAATTRPLQPPQWLPTGTRRQRRRMHRPLSRLSRSPPQPRRHPLRPPCPPPPHATRGHRRDHPRHRHAGNGLGLRDRRHGRQRDLDRRRLCRHGHRHGNHMPRGHRHALGASQHPRRKPDTRTARARLTRSSGTRRTPPPGRPPG